MDCTVPSGSGSCWPSQAASSRGPATSIWISPLAAGAAVFTVPSKLTAPPGTPRSISIGLGSPAATPSGRVTVPARVARLPSMVTPPSSLTGWSAPAWLIARSIASACRFSLPTRSSKLTTPPSTRMSPRTKPGIGVLAAGSFAAASPLGPLPKSQFRRPSSPTSRLSCGRVTIRRSTLIRLSRQKARRSTRASSASTRANASASPQSALAIRMSAAVIVTGGHARSRNGSPNVTCRPVAIEAPRSTAHFCSGEGTNRKPAIATIASRRTTTTPIRSLRMRHLTR